MLLKAVGSDCLHFSTAHTCQNRILCVQMYAVHLAASTGDKDKRHLWVAEIIHIHLNSLQCRLDPTVIIISNSPPPSKMSMCKWWRHSGEGWEALYQRHQNNSQSIHAALHSPICLPPSLSPSEAPLGSRILQQQPAEKPNSARVLNYCSSSALSSRRVNQFSFGQQQQVQL